MGNVASAKAFYGIVFPTYTEVEDPPGSERTYGRISLIYAFLKGVDPDEAECFLLDKGLLLEYAGHPECPEQPFIGILSTERETPDWGACSIGSLEVPEGSDEKLREVCETLGLPYSQPTWCVACFYG